MRIGIPMLGAFSTNYFIDELEKIQEVEVVTYPFPFEVINALLPNKFEELIPVLKECFLEVNPSEYDKMVIPNITLHQALDMFLAYDRYKVVHPLKSLDLNRANYSIIATSYTMKGDYLRSFDSKFSSPSLEDMKLIDFHRVNLFKTGACDFTSLNAILSKYEAIVLACTEFSMVKEKIVHPNKVDLSEEMMRNAVKKN